VKGKPWSVEDEKRLKDWVNLGVSVDAIVFSFDGQYTKDAILRKMGRLGLEVVALEKKNVKATSSFELPEELPSIEETLLTLAAALELLKTSGLDKSEVLRLRGIVAGCKVYKELLVDYMNYGGLEEKLLELKKKYE
jgi:hypothetical protein